MIKFRASTAVLGLAAISFFLAHGCNQYLHGRMENLLWACHLADLLVGVGLILKSRTITATGLVMLGFGVPMWLMALATGGDFYPTSILTHIGGMGVGIAGLRQLGGLRDDWWKAYATILLLLVISRCFTPASMNVNMAFETWSFARSWMPGLSAHLLSLLTIWATGLFVAERLLRLVTPPRGLESLKR
jgi:hypothetical protein